MSPIIGEQPVAAKANHHASIIQQKNYVGKEAIYFFSLFFYKS
jgi:hypothetical protein